MCLPGIALALSHITYFYHGIDSQCPEAKWKTGKDASLMGFDPQPFYLKASTLPQRHYGKMGKHSPILGLAAVFALGDRRIVSLLSLDRKNRFCLKDKGQKGQPFDL